MALSNYGIWLMGSPYLSRSTSWESSKDCLKSLCFLRMGLRDDSQLLRWLCRMLRIDWGSDSMCIIIVGLWETDIEDWETLFSSIEGWESRSIDCEFRSFEMWFVASLSSSCLVFQVSMLVLRIRIDLCTVHWLLDLREDSCLDVSSPMLELSNFTLSPITA